MTKWLQASRRVLTEDKTDRTDKTPETNPSEQVVSVLSVSSQRQSVVSDLHPDQHNDMRHGMSKGGRPLTYSGRVVSLEDWRTLSEWEKHGPDGRAWNCTTQQWEMSE